MEIIAKKLGAPVVPYMGQFTIDEAIDFVRKGFKSTIAENPDYDAEGLVLKPPDGLMTRQGEHIIFKIKHAILESTEKSTELMRLLNNLRTQIIMVNTSLLRAEVVKFLLLLLKFFE